MAAYGAEEGIRRADVRAVGFERPWGGAGGPGADFKGPGQLLVFRGADARPVGQLRRAVAQPSPL